MATDPYSSLGEGVSGGFTSMIGLAGAKAKQEEAQREAAKAKFEAMMSVMERNVSVLKGAKGTELLPLKQAAANGILAVMKQNAKDIGLPPEAIPDSLKLDDDQAETMINGISSLNKMYQKGIITRLDYLSNLQSLSMRWYQTYGEENPNIMSGAKEMVSHDKSRFSATQGTDRKMFQETEPGSGSFSPMVDAQGNPISGPAAQRIEMVKPPSESERTKIAELQTDIVRAQETLDTVKTNPAWVGIGRDAWSKISAKWDLLPIEQQEFYAKIRLQNLADTKFYLGTAQSKQEAKNKIGALPDIGNGYKAFVAAVQNNQKNKTETLSRTLEILKKSGMKVSDDSSPEAVLQAYKGLRNKGKRTPKQPTGESEKPPLLMLLEEAEKEGESK